MTNSFFPPTSENNENYFAQANLTDEVIKTYSASIDNQLKEFDGKTDAELTDQEREDRDRLLLAKQQLLETIQQDSRYSSCFSRETTGKSWSYEESPDCVSLATTPIVRWTQDLYNQERDLPDPCGEASLAKVSIALTRFFNTLKSIKKYGQLYVYGSLNKLAKIQDLIASTSEIIAAVLKFLVERIRSWLLNKIRQLIELVVEATLNTIGELVKDALVDEIVKAIMCKFDEIIKGLTKLVTDFLFALVQNVINPIFCAVEQFVNALINNLAAQIDEAIQPLLNSLNDVLGGVAQVAGSVFQALDYVLNFEQFLCTAPDCPEIKSYTGNDGPSKTEIDNFNNFLGNLDSDAVTSSVTGWISNFSVFNEKLGDVPSIGLLPCDVDAFRCGPPQVDIFGGGGVGAIANAVVNSFGQIIGVDLVAPGSGYTTPPYVTFRDSCSNSSFTGEKASAYSIINDRGQVIRIVMVNPGYNYSNTFTGLDEFGNPVVSGSNIGTPGVGGGTISTPTGITTTTSGNPVPVQEELAVFDYVVCLSELQVLSTGIGYQPTDTITITPDIPNLQAGVRLTEEGQIIEITLLNQPCGLSEIPEITINSRTGTGAVFRPVLEVTRVENFETDPDLRFAGTKLVRVIDCVR